MSFARFLPVRRVAPSKIRKVGDEWTCVQRLSPLELGKIQDHLVCVGENARLGAGVHRRLVPGDKLATITIRRTENSWSCVRSASCSLNIANVNCNGIRSKVPQLEAFLEQEAIDVVIGTESKLCDEVHSSEVFPPNYRIFRKDRVSGAGGVFIAVKENIPCHERTDLRVNETELIWCQLSLKCQTMLVGAFYRRPDQDFESLINLGSSLATARAESTSACIVLGGDFNVPGIDWTKEIPEAKTSLHDRLFEVANEHLLTQMVPFTTRRHHNGTENTLDLIYTNHPALVRDVRPHSGIGDHSAVLATIDVKTKIDPKPPRIVPQWRKANINEFRLQVRSFASKYFTENPDTRTVDENWNVFKNALNAIVKSNIPHKTYKGYKGAPWFNNELKKMARKKEKLYARAKSSGNDALRIKHNDYQDIVNKAIRAAKREHVSEVVNSKDPKKFWRYVRSNRKDNTGVPVLKVENNTLTGDCEKAKALSNQFQSVFTREDPDVSNLPKVKYPPFEDMPEIIVSVDGVEKLLKNIDPSKAAGPDEVSNYALKMAYEEIAPVLCHIFQQSIDTGNLPDDWRRANVAPIYKKGATTDPANYRPISLTSVCCKLLEHIIDSQLMKHLERLNILCDEQHAFRRGRSTESQLILTMHDLTKNLNDRVDTDMAILDFSKAFDVVPHRRLLVKLDHYGIRGKLKRWIENFLTTRQQRVVVNGAPSPWEKVLSGVPQGTVLGPHLFLLFINDIGDEITSNIRLFADDCLIYRAIKGPEDETILQNDLSRLVKWTETWGMHFNSKKCNVMRISNKKKQHQVSYKMMDDCLQHINSCQYLGIHIQSNLKWNLQSQYAASKASRVLGFVRRNFHHAPLVTKEKLYHTLVRPHLEYGIAAWDPYLIRDIDMLERVQRKAARFVTGNYSRNTSVTAMMEQLGWKSLQARRRAHRLTCLYKIQHNGMAISKEFMNPKVTRSRRGHNQQFQLYSARLDLFKNSFFPRTIREWNELSSNVVSQASCAAFKQGILA